MRDGALVRLSAALGWRKVLTLNPVANGVCVATFPTRFTLYPFLHSSPYTLSYTLHPIPFSTLFTLHPFLHSSPYTLSYTLHPYTLHPTPFPTLFTMHPEP